MCFTPLSSLGDIITKDGVNIRLYMKGSKKPIETNVLSSGIIHGLYGDRCNDFLDRIVFSTSLSSLTKEVDITIDIFRYGELEDECKPTQVNEKIIVLSKIISSIPSKNNSLEYGFHIYPWIDHEGLYQIVIRENNSILLDINYCITWCNI